MQDEMAAAAETLRTLQNNARRANATLAQLRDELSMIRRSRITIDENEKRLLKIIDSGEQARIEIEHAATFMQELIADVKAASDERARKAGEN